MVTVEDLCLTCHGFFCGQALLETHGFHGGDEGGIEAVMVAFHHTAQAEFLLGLQQGVIALVPLGGEGIVGNHAEVPFQTCGIGLRIEADALLLGKLALGAEIVAVFGMADGVVCGTGGDAVHVVVLIHLKGGHKRDAGRQVLDQLQAVCLGSVAPVVGPEHDVGIGLVGADDLLQKCQPLGIVLAGEPAGAGLVDGDTVVKHRGDHAGHAGILTGEGAAFADQHHTLEIGAVLEDLAVGAVIVLPCIGIVGVALASEVAVGIHVQTVACGAPDQGVEIHKSLGGHVHALDKDKDGVHTCVGDGGQMGIGIVVKAVAGVGHSGGEFGHELLLAGLAEGAAAQGQHILEAVDGLSRAALVMTQQLHAAFFAHHLGGTGDGADTVTHRNHQSGSADGGKIVIALDGKGNVHGASEVFLQIQRGIFDHAVCGSCDGNDIALIDLHIAVFLHAACEIIAVPLQHPLTELKISFHSITFPAAYSL